MIVLFKKNTRQTQLTTNFKIKTYWWIEQNFTIKLQIYAYKYSYSRFKVRNKLLRRGYCETAIMAVCERYRGLWTRKLSIYVHLKSSCCFRHCYVLLLLQVSLFSIGHNYQEFFFIISLSSCYHIKPSINYKLKTVHVFIFYKKF